MSPLIINGEKIMDLVLILILLLLLFGGGGGLYWGLGYGWGIGPIGLIVAVLVVAFLLNSRRGRL
jgi:fatty acid desaturase